MSRLSRRAVLLGCGAASLCGCATHRRDRSTAPTEPTELTTPAPGVPAAVRGVVAGPVDDGHFVSTYREGERVRWALMRPPGVSGPLPLVIALHGSGGSVANLLDDEWSLPRFLAAAVAAGAPPFAIGAASGGYGFWHPRPWGEDAGAMVTEELLPMLAARRDVDARRLGLIGWSMGGYGVLRMAGVLGRRRIGAVVASSPGLYLDPDLALRTGFVDAAEYEEFSVMDRQSDLAGIPLRIDVGTADPFYPAVRSYVDGFPPGADVSATFGAGGHELAFTQRVLPGNLAFLGSALARG